MQKIVIRSLPVALALAMGLLPAQKVEERFEQLVREDFFAGMSSDQARFNRGMQKCEEVLAKDPKNPSALVWHGTGLFVRSGVAYRQGDTASGQELNQRAMKEMGDAVALAPESLQTRIPRGAILISSARYMDDDIAKPYLEIGVQDYEKALALQKRHFDQLSAHAKGELLGGIADAYRRLGNTAKAQEFLNKIARDLPGTPYDKQAARWLKDLSAVGKQERFCLGCHQ